MYYLRVEHTGDYDGEFYGDADYYRFNSLKDAITYIEDEKLSNWKLSDVLFEEISEGDYTPIQSTEDSNNVS